VCLSVCVLVTTLSPVERIYRSNRPLGCGLRWAPGNPVLDRGRTDPFTGRANGTDLPSGRGICGGTRLDIPGRARGRYTHCYSQEAARAVRHLATGTVAACFGGVGRPLLLPGSNLSAVVAMAVTDRGRSALVDSPSAGRRVLPTQTQRRRHNSENLAGRVHILPFYLFTSPTELSMGWVDPSIGLGCYSRLCGCHNFLPIIRKMGGSVAEWLACWTQAQKGPGSNRSRDAVG